MQAALGWTILGLVGIFVVLTGWIVLHKGRREARERRETARRLVLEPLLLEYALGGEISLVAALGNEARASDRDVVERMLLDHAQRVRGEAREKLARALEEAGHIEDYLRALRSRRAWRRAWAAERLALAAARRAVPDLSRALEDPVAEVRMRAAKALGQLGGAVAVRQLVRALDEPNRWSSIRVADVLADLGDAAVRELVQAFPELGLSGRAATLDLLARLRSLESVEWIEKRLEDEAPDVRSRAAHALGAIGDPRSVGPLLVALDDAQWPVRAQAARALGRIGRPAAVPGLRQALRDPQWPVRTNAARALRTTGPPGQRALEASLDSGDRFERDQALCALEESGVVDLRARDLLATSLDERDEAERFLRRVVAAGGTARLRALAQDGGLPGIRERLDLLLPAAPAGQP